MSEAHSTPLQRLQEHIVSLAPVVHWLEQHPELADARVAWAVREDISLLISSHEADSAERFAAAVRALKDGAPIGTVRRRDDDTMTRFERTFGDVTVSVYTLRSAVCERVVVGTETVEIPAVEAAPARTEEREVVEWHCRPVLADTEDAVTA